MHDILNILYEYSIKNKIINLDFITEIIKIKNMELGLTEYITELKIVDDNYFIEKYGFIKNILASYDPLYKIIELNFNKIKENSIKSAIINNLSKLEFYFNINCHILYVLFHEIEHAYQFKLSKNEDINNLEVNLSKLDFYIINKCEVLTNLTEENNIDLSKNIKILNKYIKRRNDFHIKFYDLSPSERLAEIKSIAYILNLINPINNEITMVEKEFKNKLMCEHLKGYDFNHIFISPTRRYIEELKKLNIYDNDIYFNEQLFILTNENKSLNLWEKMTFGLDISKDEYTKIKKLVI